MIEVLRAQAVTDAPAMFPAAARIAGGAVVAYSTVPDGWPGGEVHVIRSVDDGATWSEPLAVGVPQGDETAVINSTGLVRLADGTLLLPLDAVTWAEGTPTEERRTALRLTRSTDDGLTWSTPELVESGYAWPANYGDLIQFDDGEVLWPVWGSLHAGERWRSGILSSRDNGRTWAGKGTIAFDPDARLTGDYVDTGDGVGSTDDDTSAPAFRPHDPTDGFNETSVIELADGRLLAVLRQQGVDGDQTLLLFAAYSDDRGATWGEYRSLGFTGMSPALHALDDGRLVLAYRRTAPDGSGIEPAVDVRIGSPDGSAWGDPAPLAEPRGERLVAEYQCGYPTIVATDDPAVIDLYFYSYSGGRYIALNRVRVGGAS